MLNKGTFQLKLIAILCFFAGYIWLEINLNAALVLLYSESLNNVFGQYSTVAHDIELFGRIITSFGLALTLVTFVPDTWFHWARKEEDTTPLPLKAVWLYRPIAFVALWIVLVPFLRLVVDTAVYESSNTDKLSAIRAVVFKEAYSRNMIEFAASKSLTDVVKDEKQRKLVIALIPSLAYFSPSVKQLIQDRTEDLAISFMESEQESAFIKEANPLIQQNISFRNKEWAFYKKAQQDFSSQEDKVGSFVKLKKLTDTKQKEVSQRVHNIWNSFNKDRQNAYDYIEPFITHYYNKEFKPDLKKYHRSSCDSRCKNNLNNQWSQKIKGLYTEVNGKRVFFDLVIDADEKWLSGKYNKKDSFRIKLKNSRNRYLSKLYGVPIDIEYEAFVAHTSTTELIVNILAKDNIKLPKSWTINDAITLKSAIKAKYKVLADLAWVNYEKASLLDIKNHNLGKLSFNKHDALHQWYRKNLGRFYYQGYQVYHSGDEVYNRWQANIDNLNFIRMLTDTAASVAFAPGGTFYQLGIEAVKFSVIPPISIVLSFIAIFALIIKFLIYLKHNDAKLKASIIVGLVFVFVAFPLIKNVTSPTSFFNIMDEFSQKTTSIKSSDHLFSQVFGISLDIESFVYQFQQSSGAGISLSSIAKLSKSLSRDELSNYAFFRRYDNWFNQTFDFVPKLIGVGDSKPPYDFNLTVYKRNLNLGFYVGLQYDKGQVTKVTIPNVLANTDAGFLLDQKLFYKPNYSQLFTEYVMSIGDVDYWLSVSDPDYARQSMLSTVEQKALKLFQAESGSNYSRLIAKSLKNNNHNLLLIQQQQGSKFDCYELPQLSIVNLLDGFSGNAFPDASKFQCKGGI